jgi:hypothetical protein
MGEAVRDTAVYWDFEPVIDAWYEWAFKTPFEPVDRRNTLVDSRIKALDVAVVLEHLGRSSIAISRAFADWSTPRYGLFGVEVHKFIKDGKLQVKRQPGTLPKTAVECRLAVPPIGRETALVLDAMEVAASARPPRRLVICGPPAPYEAIVKHARAKGIAVTLISLDERPDWLDAESAWVDLRSLEISTQAGSGADLVAVLRKAGLMVGRAGEGPHTVAESRHILRSFSSYWAGRGKAFTRIEDFLFSGRDAGFFTLEVEGDSIQSVSPIDDPVTAARRKQLRSARDEIAALVADHGEPILLTRVGLLVSHIKRGRNVKLRDLLTEMGGFELIEETTPNARVTLPNMPDDPAAPPTDMDRRYELLEDIHTAWEAGQLTDVQSVFDVVERRIGLLEHPSWVMWLIRALNQPLRDSPLLPVEGTVDRTSRIGRFDGFPASDWTVAAQEEWMALLLGRRPDSDEATVIATYFEGVEDHGKEVVDAVRKIVASRRKLAK